MYRYFSVKIGLLLILLGMVSCAEHLEDMSQGDTSLLKVRGVFSDFASAGSAAGAGEEVRQADGTADGVPPAQERRGGGAAAARKGTAGGTLGVPQRTGSTDGGPGGGTVGRMGIIAPQMGQKLYRKAHFYPHHMGNDSVYAGCAGRRPAGVGLAHRGRKGEIPHAHGVWKGGTVKVFRCYRRGRRPRRPAAYRKSHRISCGPSRTPAPTTV